MSRKGRRRGKSSAPARRPVAGPAPTAPPGRRGGAPQAARPPVSTGGQAASGTLRPLTVVIAVLALAAAGYWWFALREVSHPAIPVSPGSGRGLNVLLITLDTVRADRIGCYGCGEVRTPAIDALAASGVRFADAVCTAPMTLPSHATLLTGLYPTHHRVRDNGTFRLAEEHQTLTETLKEAGYATAAFIGAFVLDRRYGLNQGFDLYEDEMGASRRFSGLRAGPPQRPGNVVTDAALDWLAKHHAKAARRPFFAWVHLFDAHTPYTPPEPYATTYSEKPYLGEIAFADEQVGRLVGALKTRSLLERTLIVVVGDHGEGLGEHYEDTHSRLIYESTMAVPMIWHCPAILGEPRVVSDRVVSTVDVTPTVLDLLGVEAGGSVDGISLLRGDQREKRGVYIETLAPQLNHGWSPLFGVRRHTDKYIEAPTPEYYDLLSDPNELRNLFGARDAKSRERKLKKILAGMRAGFDAASDVAPARVTPDADALQKLAALGYVTSVTVPSAASNLDPKVMIRLYRKHQYASALQNEGRYREAAAQYREILEQTPEDGTAWACLSLALGEQNLLDEAIEASLKVIELRPEARTWIYLARLQMLKGDEEACEMSLGQAVRIDPTDGEIALIRGERALRQKRYAQALPYFEQARQVDPSRQSVNSYALTGKVLAALGDVDAAREAYRQALYCDPGDARVLDELADLEERDDNAEAALPHRRALCEVYPDRIKYANELAQCYMNLGRAEEAIAALREFAGRRPKDRAAAGNLGNILFESGQIEEAIGAYRKALEISPEYTLARYNLAGALSRKGDVEGAMEQCRAALEQRPDYAGARRRLMKLLVTAERFEEAFSELEHAAARGLIDWTGLAGDDSLTELVHDPRFATLRRRYPGP